MADGSGRDDHPLALDAATTALRHAIEARATAAERHALDSLLRGWPRLPDRSPDRPDSLRQGLQALLDQIIATRRAGIDTALRDGLLAAVLGGSAGFATHLVLEVAWFGRAWMGPPPLFWLAVALPALALGAFGYRQARSPTRRSRAWFRALMALPVGGLATAPVAVFALAMGGDAMGMGEDDSDAVLALAVLLVVLVSLAGGLGAALWAARRARRRWDDAGTG